jgi:ribosome maturation factor RimP
VLASDRIAEVVRPVLDADGHALYDVEVTGATVRVLVEGAGLEELEQLSPKVSAALDGIDDELGRWFLEVSSPGLERPLRRPEHFRTAVGSAVKVKTTPSSTGERRVEGVLEAADDDGVVVAGRRLAYDEIDRARTVFEWGPPPKRTSRPSQRRSHP